jgi:tetratricopeptide (TPR) repeat protein
LECKADNRMEENGNKLGKMGLAMIEVFVEIKLGDKYNRRLAAQTEEYGAIKEALQNTANQLWKDWTDKQPWNAFFIDLPKKKELLINLKQAARKFYAHPTNMDFSGVLTEILHGHDGLSPEDVQKAVGDYTTTLAEQLLLVDKGFHKNMRKHSGKRKVKPLPLEEDPPVNQPQPSNSPTLQVPSAVQVEVVAVPVPRASLARLPVIKIPKPSQLPKCSHFPELPPDPSFVGREDFLLNLARWLKGSSPETIIPVAILTGMEGIGKTWLAREFAHRYGRYLPGGVFWLNFAQPDLIPYEVAECSGLSYLTPLEIRVRQVVSDWKGSKPRLLIFDNCEDPLVLEKWLPTTGGSRVLVTSRQEDWDLGPKVQMPLPPLSRPASLTLLRELGGIPEGNDRYLDAIACELEDIPLAIQKAGSFLRFYHRVVRPRKYLNILRQSSPQRVHSARIGEFSPAENELKVERTVAIGIDRLLEGEDANRQSLDLLRQIAVCVAGEFIPPELFTATPSGTTDMHSLQEGLNKLQGMGLVELNEMGEVRMHRLVAWLIREILQGREAQSRVEKAILSVAVTSNQTGNLDRIWPLLVHLKYFTDQNLRKKNRQAARLATELGNYLESIGDFPGARSYFKQAMEINRKILGEEHPDTTTSFNKLGGLLVKMGNYSGARPFFRHSLDIHRKVLGDAHPDTASSLNALGGLMANLGEYGASQQYYDQSLAIRRRALGENHPDTASSLNALGGLLARMGDYPAARQYCEQALAIRRQVLGEDHPDSAASLNNLGEVLQAMGDLEGARSCYEQALTIRRKVLGEDHLETAACLTNLGELLKLKGDYPGARNYYMQALAIRKNVLGETHPATLASLSNLGNLLQVKGDESGANAYFEQVQAIQRKIQEENRPATPSRTGLLALPWRTRIALAALLVFAVTVISWQVFSQRNVSSTSENYLIPTPSEVGAAPNAFLFPQLGPKVTRTPSRTPTITRTRMPSPTNTRYMSPTPTNTVPYVILPSRTPTKTAPPTRYPSAIPPSATPRNNTVPTNTPTFVPTPTSALPTLVPTDTPFFITPTVAPPDTPVPPTDIPIPPSATTAPIGTKEVSSGI